MSVVFVEFSVCVFRLTLCYIDKGQWREFGQDTGVTPYSLQEMPWDF